MKRYEIETVPNPLCRRVSVPKEVRDEVVSAINELPFIDQASAMSFEATQVHVLISALAEPGDLEVLEKLVADMTKARG